MTRETDVRNPATDRMTTSRSAQGASQTEEVSRRLSAEHTVERGSFGGMAGNIWETFAAFGIGPDTRSNGAFVTGIVTDYSSPPESTVEGEIVTIVSAAVGYWVVQQSRTVHAFGDVTGEADASVDGSLTEHRAAR